MLSLLAAAVVASATATAGPRAGQLHLQLQTGVLARETATVDVGADRASTGVGPGAGGVTLSAGTLLTPRDEVGGRLEMARLTLDDGRTQHSESELRLGATYTRWFRLDQDLRPTATVIAGLHRQDWDGDARSRAAFVGAGGGVHYFVTKRFSLNAGVELARTLGGQIEVDGRRGAQPFVGWDASVVGGANFLLGGKKKSPKPKAHAKKTGVRGERAGRR
jgi:hypothetical protein